MRKTILLLVMAVVSVAPAHAKVIDLPKTVIVPKGEWVAMLQLNGKSIGTVGPYKTLSDCSMHSEMPAGSHRCVRSDGVSERFRVETNTDAALARVGAAVLRSCAHALSGAQNRAVSRWDQRTKEVFMMGWANGDNDDPCQYARGILAGAAQIAAQDAPNNSGPAPESATGNSASAPDNSTSDGGANAGSLAIGFILLLIGGVFYLVPGFVASDRGHRNAAAIWALDILLGWTFIGWVVALVWALTSPPPPPPSVPREAAPAKRPESQ
ncbi:MAG: superinfection immunity protein [Candidatus Binataceae bacterium]